jgi:non-specific protein-tyrosine kinase
LRRPSQHQIFNARNNAGITDLVRDEALLANPPLQETSVLNLKLLTSGQLPPNPSELLGSRRMEEIIAALLTRADVLLFDAPPILAVTDAAVLSSKVDGVLLVIGAGKTRREDARKAKALLDKVNARLIGTVLNNVKFDSSLQYYYSEQTSG